MHPLMTNQNILLVTANQEIVKACLVSDLLACVRGAMWMFSNFPVISSSLSLIRVLIWETEGV